MTLYARAHDAWILTSKRHDQRGAAQQAAARSDADQARDCARAMSAADWLTSKEGIAALRAAAESGDGLELAATVLSVMDKRDDCGEQWTRDGLDDAAHRAGDEQAAAAVDVDALDGGASAVDDYGDPAVVTLHAWLDFDPDDPAQKNGPSAVDIVGDAAGEIGWIVLRRALAAAGAREALRAELDAYAAAARDHTAERPAEQALTRAMVALATSPRG